MIDLASDDDNTPAANTEDSNDTIGPFLQRKVYIFENRLLRIGAL
jgi:hypothetical protein